MKKLLESLDKLTECPPMEGGEMPPAPANPGNPVTMSVSLNASGMDYVADLMKLLKQAGLEQAGPAAAPVMPMRMDMERLRNIVDEPEMEADAAYSDVITDDEDLEESMDPKEVMGQIRKMAKGVETSPDEREHRIFAQQVESELIDLFQYFSQKNDAEKKQILQNLIRQNRKAQQQTDRRNANNMVSVLWDLMNANEAYDNEPEPEYQDHKYMTKDLAGGLNREKRQFKPAAKGDNPMAVETIKKNLMAALQEKKAKPDFLDMDKDGNKKEPMKKALKDKKKKGPVKESSSIDNTIKMIFGKIYDYGDAGLDYLDNNAPLYDKLANQFAGDLDAILANTPDQVKMNLAKEMKSVLDSMKFELESDAKTSEAEVQAPTHELDDTARKAMNIAQMIKRKINSGEQMDDRDYNQMAELGSVLSRFGASFGPKSMTDVLDHMVQYTDDRNQEGHKYPEFNVDRFKELIAMAKSTGESIVGEISSDLAKRYTKAAKMDRDFNDDDIDRLSKSGQSTQAMHRRNAKRTKGINQAKMRMQ